MIAITTSNSIRVNPRNLARERAKIVNIRASFLSVSISEPEPLQKGSQASAAAASKPFLERAHSGVYGVSSAERRIADSPIVVVL